MDDQTNPRKETSSVPVAAVPMGAAPAKLPEIVDNARVNGQHTVLLLRQREVAAVIPIDEYRKYLEYRRGEKLTA